MASRARLLLVVSIASLFGLVACGGDDMPPPMVDGGYLPDNGPPRCGDGEQFGSEICDDGNNVDGDGCSANCASVERCGNGYLDEPIGEICDDGNSMNGDGCDAECLSDESCGNGLVDLGVGEVCDDGNTMDGDGCSADCMTGPICGDGMTNPPEVCDDGNTDGGDGCSADCLSDESCGNGTLDAGEECDDSNTMDGDGCSAACLTERCGNGVMEGTEACDDGNTTDGDGCDNDCTLSCTAAAECDDSMPCNGVETCGSSSACEPGAPPADGTDCGGGMVCRAGGCVAPVCGNGTREATEQCDDGNSVNGDGCENDCTFSCEMTSDCDDGNLCTGAETCTVATHTCTNPADAADGTSCGGGRVCRGGACVATMCGNGIPESGEQCDDGNTTDGDGCDNDCTWSCTTAADCTDGNSCNGTESCNTMTHRCASGTPPAAGTACDRDMMPATRDICRMNMCLASTCGDGYVDGGGGEQCEDGNMVNGDGCDNDCTWSCTVAADCTDGLVCNGAETCNTMTHRCGAGTPAANGTACDRDMMMATRDICLMASCVLSRCGDGYIDTMAMPPEVCDDGNMVAGDGCEPTCVPSGPRPTVFRVDTLDLMDPHVFMSFFGCRDITDTPPPLSSTTVNGELQASLDDYTLNYLTAHRPLDLAMSMNVMDIIDGVCMDAGAMPPVCNPAMPPITYPSTANNRPAGMTCYTADATTLTAMYPDPNVVTGPCFVSNPTNITVSLGGINIPLRDARFAATYSGGLPPTRLVSGVISGFLTEADARAAILPASLPLIGGDSLWQHLAAGGASGSSCASHDDRDTYGGMSGFWFYLNFTSELADWRGP